MPAYTATLSIPSAIKLQFVSFQCALIRSNDKKTWFIAYLDCLRAHCIPEPLNTQVELVVACCVRNLYTHAS